MVEVMDLSLSLSHLKMQEHLVGHVATAHKTNSHHKQ